MNDVPDTPKAPDPRETPVWKVVAIIFGLAVVLIVGNVLVLWLMGVLVLSDSSPLR